MAPADRGGEADRQRPIEGGRRSERVGRSVGGLDRLGLDEGGGVGEVFDGSRRGAGVDEGHRSLDRLDRAVPRRPRVCLAAGKMKNGPGTEITAPGRCLDAQGRLPMDAFRHRTSSPPIDLTRITEATRPAVYDAGRRPSLPPHPRRAPSGRKDPDTRWFLRLHPRRSRPRHPLRLQPLVRRLAEPRRGPRRSAGRVPLDGAEDRGGSGGGRGVGVSEV